MMASLTVPTLDIAASDTASSSPPLDSNEQCPDYSQNCSLHPTTAVATYRYDRQIMAYPKHMIVQAGLYGPDFAPEPPYIPEGWTAYVHTEGNVYFYNSTLRILTNEYIYHAEIYEKVTVWCTLIQARLHREGRVLGQSSEFFVELVPETHSCNYYVVDHDTRSEFWLDDFCSDALQLPPVTSETNLKHLLESHYWQHVENFPTHRALPENAVEELINSLSIARMDHLTSNWATFPYNAIQIEELISVLRHYRPLGKNDAKITWIVARINSFVARHKFENFFGEEHARISRDQVRIDDRSIERPLSLKVLYWLLWNCPENYLRRFDIMWIDRRIVKSQWLDFTKICTAEWKETVYLSIGLLLVDCILLCVPSETQVFGLVSSACAAGSVISSSFLLEARQISSNTDACSAAMYLSSIDHPRYGLQPTSIAFSLPRALLLWCMALLAINIVVLVWQLPNLVAKVAVIIPIAGLGFFVVMTLALMKPRGEELEQEANFIPENNV